jgi:DNA-binding NarL/FixJ family response regulator
MTPTAAAAQKTRILIIAGSADRRAHLRSLLSADSDFEISADQADKATGERAVIVLDLERDRLSRGILPTSRAGVVVLADNQDLNWIAETFPSDPIALLKRNCEPKQLVAAIQAVAQGLTVLEPEALDSLLRPSAESIALEPGDEELTSRETEVLQMMTAGLTNREIAAALAISEHTVKFHIASIFGKMGTSTRTETVTEGIRRRLILL